MFCHSRIIIHAKYNSNNVLHFSTNFLPRFVRPSLVNKDNQYDYLSDIVTPLWNKSYNDQLKWKQNEIHFTMDKIAHRRKMKTPTVKKIIPSPVTERYRNKDHFSIGYGIDGNSKTVGFYIGSPSHGNVLCVPPKKLINIKEKHILLSQVFQELLNASDLNSCLNFKDGGFWRNLLVRSNSKGETMVVITVHPMGASHSLLISSMEKAKEYFTAVGVDSIYYQVCDRTKCLRSQAPFNLLHGQSYLIEELGDFKFRISPDSFFQVNTDAAKILYETVLNLARLRKKTTLLDLCCGTGTISVFASQYVRGCTGIEVIPEAIADAEHNAVLNQVANCDFICGPLETKLKNVFKVIEYTSDVCVILNPGRAGVARSVIKTLRDCIQLTRIIYVSCKIDAPTTARNFADLCCPDFHPSKPFSLPLVQPVDMFPQTNHCENILVFQRN